MSPRGAGDPRLRDRLLEAAADVTRSEGVQAVTIRRVARRAGLADGTLYNHFADKDELLRAVVANLTQRAEEQVTRLAELPGTATVRENLLEVVRAGLAALSELAPLLAALGEQAVATDPVRPHGAPRPANPVIRATVEYLRAEQRLGRIGPDADPEAAATLLIGACHDIALHHPANPPDPTLPERLVDTLLAGLGA